MNLILNIGMARDGNSNIGVGTALREIANTGFVINSHSIRHSDTEFTVVADVTLVRGKLDQAVDFLCLLLDQGCIAVWSPIEREGRLIGPGAAEWGLFNPEFFLMLDGSRLSDVLTPA